MMVMKRQVRQGKGAGGGGGTRDMADTHPSLAQGRLGGYWKPPVTGEPHDEGGARAFRHKLQAAGGHIADISAHGS